ncbi:elongation factor Tu, mitochondrial [Tanacetum coccineum]
MSLEPWNFFSLSMGRGTVGTGRAEQGTGSKNTTVTGVEMSKKSLDNGEASDNVGLPLRGISRTGIQIGRKSKLSDEGGRHTTFISIYRPHFYFRTANVIGKVDLLENLKMIMRGDNVTAAFELTTPVVLEPGQRFALGGRKVSTPSSLKEGISVYRELKEHKNGFLEFYGECKKENDKKSPLEKSVTKCIQQQKYNNVQQLSEVSVNH